MNQYLVLTFVLFLLLFTEDSQAWTTTGRGVLRRLRFFSTRAAVVDQTSVDSRLLLVKDCENLEDGRCHAADDLVVFSSAPSRRQWLQGVVTSACSTLLLQPTKTLAATRSSSASIVSSAATCDPTVSVWQRGDRFIYLLGTAHISQVSARLAGQLVQDVYPNAVFIELDLKRVGGLSATTKPTSITTRSVDLGLQQQQQQQQQQSQTVPTSRILVPAVTSAPTIDVEARTDTTTPSMTATALTSSEAAATVDATTPTTKNKRAASGFGLDMGAAAIGNAIRGMYQNLDRAGFKPGEEFVEAVREGRKIGADIVLGDRDVQVTLRRLVQALQVTDMQKLMDPNNPLEQSMRELLPGGGAPQTDAAAFKDEVSAFVEAIKTRERVRNIMSQLNEVAPALVQVMLTERDAYMAAGLDSLNQYLVIVAVMGIAHQDGVEQNLRIAGWKQVKPRCRR